MTKRKKLNDEYIAHNPTFVGGKTWEDLDLQKVYDVLAKLLSQDKDYTVKFTVTRKEDE